MTRKTLDPKQARSRESTRKLLKATAEILGQSGLEGTTIPRIARHAGLTPGAIYRRFTDKDALIETMIIGILERSDEHLRAALTPAMASQIPLPVLVDQIIDSMLVSYRANASLLRALRQFAQSSKNSRFVAKVRRTEMRTLRYGVDLLLVHKKQIRHPDQEMALFFAVMMLSAAMMELFVVDRDGRSWFAVIPKDHQTLKSEFKRMFLNYLDIERNDN
ncbi:MAG: TetR/AcrR family transcriptional regulator [Gammaproteobacteria bacterium]